MANRIFKRLKNLFSTDQDAKRNDLSSCGLSPLVDLPDEIWLKIIQYLPTKDIFGSFALVHKKFDNLTRDSSAVKYLQLRAIDTWSKFESVSKVIAKSKSLIKLKIDLSCDFDNELICQTFRSNPRLKALTINSTFLNIETFNIIVKSKIEFLDYFVDNELSPDEIARLCSIKTLTKLTLSHIWSKKAKDNAYKNGQWDIFDVLVPNTSAPPNSPSKVVI